MRRHRTMMARTTLSLVALVTALAACADDRPPSAQHETSSAAEDGVSGYDDEHVTFAVPGHFERTDPGDELTDGLEVEFLNDPSGEQPLPEQITLGYGVPDSDAFDIAAWPTFAFGPMLGDDEKLDEEEIEVEGVDGHGLRVTYRFHEDGLDEPWQTTAVGVIVDGPDGPLIADLRYAALESEYDEQVADEVMSSLTVR